MLFQKGDTRFHPRLRVESHLRRSRQRMPSWICCARQGWLACPGSLN